MALRDAGRALGFAPKELDAWARQIGPGPAPDSRAVAGESLPSDVPAPVAELAAQMLRLPRHLGIHSGGMVICDRPVGEVKKLVTARFIRNDWLIDALMAQAFSALKVSPGARVFYDDLRARGIEHNDAPRRVANRATGRRPEGVRGHLLLV